MAERNAKGVSNTVRGLSGAAGETLKRAGSAARGATGAVSDVTPTDTVQGAGQQVQAAAEGAGRAVERAGGGGAQRTLGEEIREIVREAAREVLVPAVRKATTQAAMSAVRRGPEFARGTIAPKLGAAIEEAGGPGALAKDVLSSASGGGTGMLERIGVGREAQPRPWRERPLPMEESIDVGAPLETVYGRFAEFEEYANVMSHGETVDERPNERIAWRSTDRGEDTAVITFHRLSDRLTRVMVTYDHQPHGLLDKTGSLFHRPARALSADLIRFKAFAEMTQADSDTGEEPGQPAEQSQARDDTREE
jgi:uncharacterized membrane protein